jgi:hypothetical protein
MAEKFSLEIPLDASGIEGFKPEQSLKVLVKGAHFERYANVELDSRGHGSATIGLPESAGALRILVGPGGASDTELLELETLSLDISTRDFKSERIKLPAIAIPAVFWWRWLRWCRTFVIRGRVLCADGSPVPGARVCAYDVDGWLFWTNTQQVGCAFTDVNGAFEIKFRWCCGLWPWWWWRSRVWQLEPSLVERVGAALGQAPDVRLKAPAGHGPSLAVFEELLGREGVAGLSALEPDRLGQLDSLRDRLLQKLPRSAELERLRIWPWFPWYPWRDCSPDIIFRVTQDCVEPGLVIVDETVQNARWDVPTALDVTLIANQNACCRNRPCPQPPCDEGECLVVTEVCGQPIDQIGGNIGAPPAPVGFLNPGPMALGSYSGDRPFAGIVPLVKNSGAMLNVDYYEIERFDGVGWVPLPPGAAVSFYREYMHMLPPSFPTTNVLFEFVTISGHNVVESKEHWLAGPGSALTVWGINYIWVQNEFLVVPLDTTKFEDGEHRFRVVGWQLQSGNLTNPRVLPLCGTEQDNGLVLFFDNRAITTPALHDPTHNCGIVHVCTTEPDTHIIQVRINGQPVAACGTVDAASGDLEIDFEVTDPDGHLGVYGLVAHYGLNFARNLLDRPGATMTLLSGSQTGWINGDSTGTYSRAVAQGATRPDWFGGRFRLRVPASEAFPEPCCYELRLEAHKRNLVGGPSGIRFICDSSYPFYNVTQMTLGVGVCPPRG